MQMPSKKVSVACQGRLSGSSDDAAGGLRVRACSWLSTLLVAGLCVHCGSATPEPATSSPEPSPPPAATEALEGHDADDDVSESAEAESEVSADESEESSPEDAEPEQAEPADEDAPRNVNYRITPDGLVVDVEGARFKPTARIRKLGNGGYGIDIEVTAESTDDRTHTLLSPEHGPLSMAVTIYDKQGEAARRHGDFRNGNDEQTIKPGSPSRLTRSWPSGSVKGPLWWGERVHIEVGLWGLGIGGERQRPLRKLFVIEMHGKGTAKPVISPPQVKR